MRLNYTLPIKLDLGCGRNKIKDFTGLDQLEFGQEILWDATKGIPLPDNSVDELHSAHFIEHIAEKDIAVIFQEILRVCKNGALVTLFCPHSSVPEAYYVCHLSLWNEQRIEGICRELYERASKFEIIENKKLDHPDRCSELFCQLRVIKQNAI